MHRTAASSPALLCRLISSSVLSVFLCLFTYPPERARARRRAAHRTKLPPVELYSFPIPPPGATTPLRIDTYWKDKKYKPQHQYVPIIHTVKDRSGVIFAIGVSLTGAVLCCLVAVVESIPTHTFIKIYLYIFVLLGPHIYVSFYSFYTYLSIWGIQICCTTLPGRSVCLRSPSCPNAVGSERAYANMRHTTLTIRGGDAALPCSGSGAPPTPPVVRDELDAYDSAVAEHVAFTRHLQDCVRSGVVGAPRSRGSCIDLSSFQPHDSMPEGPTTPPRSPKQRLASGFGHEASTHEQVTIGFGPPPPTSVEGTRNEASTSNSSSDDRGAAVAIPRLHGHHPRHTQHRHRHGHHQSRHANPPHLAVRAAAAVRGSVDGSDELSITPAGRRSDTRHPSGPCSASDAPNLCGGEDEDGIPSPKPAHPCHQHRMDGEKTVVRTPLLMDELDGELMDIIKRYYQQKHPRLVQPAPHPQPNASVATRGPANVNPQSPDREVRGGGMAPSPAATLGVGTDCDELGPGTATTASHPSSHVHTRHVTVTASADDAARAAPRATATVHRSPPPCHARSPQVSPVTACGHDTIYNILSTPPQLLPPHRVLPPSVDLPMAAVGGASMSTSYPTLDASGSGVGGARRVTEGPCEQPPFGGPHVSAMSSNDCNSAVRHRNGAPPRWGSSMATSPAPAFAAHSSHPLIPANGGRMLGDDHPTYSAYNHGHSTSQSYDEEVHPRTREAGGVMGNRLPTYSSTSFVRAYVSEVQLNMEPAVIVSGLAAGLNMIVVYFLQNHVLDTRDHLGLFLIGSYLIFASYYMVYYFLERFSSSFRRISSQDKKFYIIGNLLKAGILISITPFAFYHLVKIVVFDTWESNILRNLGCIYAIPDFISMIIVKRMRWSTWTHHLVVVIFNYFSIMNDYTQENICRCVVVYAAFSSFAYCVNVLLASRFLGVSVRVARVLSFVALVVYVLCCAINWAWQVYYLRRLLRRGHDHWTVYVYMMLICLVMWDDIMLNRWLLNHARNTAFAASQQIYHKRRQLRTHT